MALVLLFYKHSSPQNSEWMNEISKNGIDSALTRFCRQIPVSRGHRLRAVTENRWTHTCTALYRHTLYIRVQHTMESGSAINLSTCLPQVTPAKFLRTAFRIRGLSSAYISRVFLRTEMALKSRNVLTGSRSLARSRSTDNLPTSQSQVNIQMMSHTLTIREVCTLSSSFSPLFDSTLSHTFCSPVTKIITTSLCRCDRIFQLGDIADC